MNVVPFYYGENFLKLIADKTEMIKLSSTSEEFINIHSNNGEITSFVYMGDNA